MTALQLAPVVMALLLLLPMLALSRRQTDPTRQALRSMATSLDVRALTPAGSLQSARRLRPDLPAQPLQRDLGVVLGRLERRGPVLRASWEDVCVAVMAPRSGKTNLPGGAGGARRPRPSRRQVEQG